MTDRDAPALDARAVSALERIAAALERIVERDVKPSKSTPETPAAASPAALDRARTRAIRAVRARGG